MIWKRERERANSWKESMEEMIIFSGEKKRKFCTNITTTGCSFFLREKVIKYHSYYPYKCKKI